jgi:hypothetical protein
VLTLLTRLTVGLIVGIFAALGFLAVPLGERTGFQHTRAIFTSSEARDFARELKNASDDLKKRILGEVASESSRADREKR